MTTVLAREAASSVFEESGDSATRMSCLRQALGRLRDARSVEQLMRKAVVETCRCFRFDRAVLFSVRGSALVAESAHLEGDSQSAEEFLRLAQTNRSQPEPSLLEAETVRRRTPILVTDPQNDPRAYALLPGDAETTAYVAAPIMPEGDVVGILHADCLFSGRPLGPHDRDTLWAFAEGVGYLLERAVLRERLDVQCENDADLTPREREVLVLMGGGATNAAIASRLVISENTVKSHVKHILRTLGAGNRAEAVALFLLAQRGGGSNGAAPGWR
jgi:LuxR family transcriptional regulator, regulator of acetate metabolism